MRPMIRALLSVAMTAGLVSVATPALANDPIDIDWGYVCVRYPCYPTDYPPYLLDEVGEIVEVHHNPPIVCVTEPCDQPPPVTVCVNPLELCTP